MSMGEMMRFYIIRALNTRESVARTRTQRVRRRLTTNRWRAEIYGAD